MTTITLRIVHKGGKGSGHHGHSGRPGKVGGSLKGTTYIGASHLSLEESIAYIESLPWSTHEYWDGGETKSWQFKKIPDELRDRNVLQALEWYIRGARQFLDVDYRDMFRQTLEEYKRQLAASDVYMRITPENLEQAILEDQFENTFLSKKSGAAYRQNKLSLKKYQAARLKGEEAALGVPADTVAVGRPIYGYWSKEGGLTSQFDAFLGQYGSVAVKFKKDAIADSLTFTSGDSLDMSDRVRSSDWRNPSIFSSHVLTQTSDTLLDAVEGPNSGVYWEAQIFDRSISNIEAVYSHTPLPESLTKLLDEKGIPWHIE